MTWHSLTRPCMRVFVRWLWRLRKREGERDWPPWDSPSRSVSSSSGGRGSGWSLWLLQVSLSSEEGGESCELVPGGATQPVTPDNVYQYVKLYAELRMIRVCHEALLVTCLLRITDQFTEFFSFQSLREGVYDVIPEGSLSSLSPEDLRLILCGCQTIDTERLRVATVFEDESSESLSLPPLSLPPLSLPPSLPLPPPSLPPTSLPHPLSLSVFREGGGDSDEVQGLVLVGGGEDESEREARAAVFLDQ